jgi:hypothetical protein
MNYGTMDYATMETETIVIATIDPE